LAVIEVRMSVIISGDMIEEEVDDNEEENDDALMEDITDEVGDDDDEEKTADKGLVKKALNRGVDKMLNGLSQTREKMAKLGLAGKIGASVMIGAFGCQISIGIDITLKVSELSVIVEQKEIEAPKESPKESPKEPVQDEKKERKKEKRIETKTQ